MKIKMMDATFQNLFIRLFSKASLHMRFETARKLLNKTHKSKCLRKQPQGKFYKSIFIFSNSDTKTENAIDSKDFS